MGSWTWNLPLPVRCACRSSRSPKETVGGTQAAAQDLQNETKKICKTKKRPKETVDGTQAAAQDLQNENK